jgi:hypothetical protein
MNLFPVDAQNTFYGHTFLVFRSVYPDFRDKSFHLLIFMRAERKFLGMLISMLVLL